jgi:hypothetical protein
MTFPLRLAKASFLVVAGAQLGACSSSSGNGATGGPDAGSDTSAPDASSDGAGADADVVSYPAFPVDLPQVEKNQGVVLTNPVIVTISWPGDSNAATWEAFGDAIGASSYWSATTGEYGVGAATSGPTNHVRMTQPLPASISYTALDSFVSATLQADASDAGAPDAAADDGGAPNPAWPAPTMNASGNVQTIYSLFIPSTTSVTDPGTGMSFCLEGANGYHAAVEIGGKSNAYSVTLACPDTTTSIEEVASHEYIEAATNPESSSPTPEGYIGFDPQDLAWDLYTGFNDELADACQNWQDSYYQETGTFPYWVQKSWSNAAALAGHNPCVPAAPGPYYGVTVFPSQESMVTVDLSSIGGTNSATRGFNVTVGTPLTFQVGYFSDASMSPWTIAYDFPATTQLFSESGNPIANGAATVSIDETTGQNGDMANVTVTVSARGAAGFHVMALTWDAPTQSGFAPHYMPVVLVDQ